MGKRKDEYHFYKRLGICTRCHKNSAEPNKVLCMECADADNERCRVKRLENLEDRRKKDLDKYKKLKADGICTYCKTRKAENGKTKCSICLAKLRNKRENNKSDILRSERSSYGICYICGKNPLLKDKGVCQSCYDVRLESIQKIMYLPAHEYWKGLNKLVFTKQGGGT